LDEEVKSLAELLKSQWRGESQRPVFLAASTHRGEDQIILDSFEQIRFHCPELLLVLVPRHPERFDEVAELCLQRGFGLCRRSSGVSPSLNDQILLGDTMGELLLFFGACDIAFVGGSLVPVGGHNLIEPAIWAVPVLSGPHLFNFSEASRLLREAQGMAICESADAIAEQIVALLQDVQAVERMGNAAKSVTDNNRGALDKLFSIIERQLS
jgi:3-deoxy-D-manno-octulosonic-acid transferase